MSSLDFFKMCNLHPISSARDSVTKVMGLVNHKARTMLLCPLYSSDHLDIRSGNRGFSP